MEPNPKFTILTAIGGNNYLEKFLITHQTWQLKSEFNSVPILILHNSIDPQKLSHIKNSQLIEWKQEDVSMRERMLSAFVLGSKHIQTPYYLKIDADCFFTNRHPIMTDDLFEYDIVAHRWGYTKPAKWLQELDSWATTKAVPGQNMNPIITGNCYGHKRFTSWFCLHKTEFVRECLSFVNGDKLPVPSHDTFLWYMANRLKKKWGRKNFKERGSNHKKHINSTIFDHIDQQSVPQNPEQSV
jgi:hypothetical protein